MTKLMLKRYASFSIAALTFNSLSNFTFGMILIVYLDDFNRFPVFNAFAIP